MEVQKSDVVVEVNESGVQQIRVYADSPRQREQALRLLVRVSPELRALERALRETEVTK
jgi:hypothetical protein